MKTIGLIGGMSWESSAEYYRLINEGVRQRLGGLHSAPIVMVSVDFAPVEALQRAGDWPALVEMMTQAAEQLERAGAELLLICSNTMHIAADALAKRTVAPLLHIVDPTAARLTAAGVSRVGLIGTALTMEQPFYRERLKARFAIETLVPRERDRQAVNTIIFDELVVGRQLDESRAVLRDVICRMADRGAQAIVLGCTELMLLVTQADTDLPVFDTTTIHAQAAIDLALARD